MVVFAGQGDAGRVMALLWRTEEQGSRRGPKPALSVEVIVAAAIAVADEQGMAALSMRAVGERLGRTAMALYTYVPSKSELVDLMYDSALAELPTSYDLAAGWREAVTAWARDTFAFYLRHAWVLQVSQARPVLGPNEFAVRETAVGVLRESGLGPGAVRSVVAALFNHVRGAAQTVAESRQAAAQTGVADEEWWQARSALLLEMVPDVAERFPMAVWLDSEPYLEIKDGEPYLESLATAAFEAGLAVLLDGVEVSVRTHRER